MFTVNKIRCEKTPADSVSNEKEEESRDEVVPDTEHCCGQNAKRIPQYIICGSVN